MSESKSGSSSRLGMGSSPATPLIHRTGGTPRLLSKSSLISGILAKESSLEATFGLPSSGRRSAPGSSPPPVKRTIRAVSSPEARSDKAMRGPGSAATPVSSRSTIVPKSSPGVAYGDRTNAGDIVSTFNAELADTTDGPSYGPVAVTSLPGDEKTITKPFRWMFTTVIDRMTTLEFRIRHMEDAFQASLGLEDVWPLGETSQEDVTVVGRICCESDIGKLNVESILLQGSYRTSRCRKVKLHNLKKLPSLASLFPGQIVAIEGKAISSDKFVPLKIHTSVAMPVTTTPVSILNKEAESGHAPLRMWVSAGPYTVNKDLKFEPLEDLFLEAMDSASPPDIIVLMGPFIGSTNPSVRKGEAQTEDRDGDTFTLPFTDLFDLVVTKFIGDALKELPDMRVVIVPAVNDAVAPPVFPQPPMKPILKAFEDRVTMVSNPATFKVGSTVIGVSSMDTTSHMMQQGIHHIPRDASGKPHRVPPGFFIHRAAEHMLEQQSFFPIFPAPHDVPVDMSMAQGLEMPATPDILISPSRLNPFTKVIKDTLVVNPGLLSKYNSGGSYAKIAIHPIKADQIKPVAVPQPEDEGRAKAEPTAPHAIPDRTRVDIVKI